MPEIFVKQKPQRLIHSPWMSKGLMVSQQRKEKLFAKKVKKAKDVNKFKIYNTLYNKLRRVAKKMYDRQFNKFAR